jgi:hypothetical protein
VVTAGAFADHLRNRVRDALSRPAPAGVYALSLLRGVRYSPVPARSVIERGRAV